MTKVINLDKLQIAIENKYDFYTIGYDKKPIRLDYVRILNMKLIDVLNNIINGELYYQGEDY